MPVLRAASTTTRAASSADDGTSGRAGSSVDTMLVTASDAASPVPSPQRMDGPPNSCWTCSRIRGEPDLPSSVPTVTVELASSLAASSWLAREALTELSGVTAVTGVRMEARFSTRTRASSIQTRSMESRERRKSVTMFIWRHRRARGTMRESICEPMTRPYSDKTASRCTSEMESSNSHAKSRAGSLICSRSQLRMALTPESRNSTSLGR